MYSDFQVALYLESLSFSKISKKILRNDSVILEEMFYFLVALANINNRNGALTKAFIVDAIHSK